LYFIQNGLMLRERAGLFARTNSIGYLSKEDRKELIISEE